ncbi:MAG: extensin family protein [Parvibaculaceae bacterium]
MRIERVLGLAIGTAVLAMLSACGSKEFTTEGLIAPPIYCLTDPRILGDAQKLDPINEGNGCQVPNPWRMYSVADVQLSQPVILNCSVTQPLHDWVGAVVQPAAQAAFSEDVTSIGIAGSYSCRARNNKRGARMSEHGFGNAIDISSFTLADGRRITVKQGWRGGDDERAFLREIRKDACAEFMTVLGPGSDSHHGDHFHLDLANRISGKAYCK